MLLLNFYCDLLFKYHMNAFTIKDLENLSGIKAHTIRIWEQRYDFLKPQRTDTNIRYYNNEELKSILNAALLNKYGYKISHISKMNPQQISDNLQRLNISAAQQERIINDLIAAMVDMQVDTFEEILVRQIDSRGIEKAIDETIFPFLEKIGILWLTNNINPAQEHLVTNLIRQKFMVAIDRLPKSYIHKSVVLFLPESEYHELGLIYVHYLFKKAGVHVIYLGANVPFADLDYIIKCKGPQLLYTHLSAPSSKFKFEKFIAQLQLTAQSTPVICSGAVFLNSPVTLNKSIKAIHSLNEVKSFVMHFSNNLN